LRKGTNLTSHYFAGRIERVERTSNKLRAIALSFPWNSTFHRHMARLSKTTPFHIHNDTGIPTPDSTYRSLEDSVNEQELPRTPAAWAGGRKDDGFVTESDDEIKGGHEDGAQEGDDEKNYRRTSISSFPESSYPTDYEPSPMHKPYTPTYSRPSTRRMQMSSPLRKGRLGTPQSEPRGSPRSRRREYDLDEEPKRLPLVLLHITALPVNLPWTVQAMREVLPQYTIDNLQLLKSKLSETVLKRGILIPHPREDYELLEEKLLETLELQEPRISKCGHYRGRHSTDSTATNGSTSADSGMGDSVDASDDEHCNTCHHHLRAAGSGRQKWSIKVYAANGLMRASAWSAAWSEMERIDVEIMPWIKDELRIKLDEMKTSEVEVKLVDREAEELRINQLVEERLRLLDEDAERVRAAQMSREIDQIVINEQRQYSQSLQETPMACIEASKSERPAPESRPIPEGRPASTELPNIYRPKDIPLSILLRNYIFLLARKPLNMAIFFLLVTIGGLVLSIGPFAMSDRLSEVSTLVMATATKTSLVEGLPLIESAPQADSLALSDLEVTIGESFEVAEVPRGADVVTVFESSPVSEEESAAALESASQLHESQPSINQETPGALLETTEDVPKEPDHEKVHEDIPDVSAVDMQEISDVSLEATEAASEGEADSEEVPGEFLEVSTVEMQETSDVLSDATETAFEEETVADDVLDEVSESSILDVVAATEDSLPPPEDTTPDVSIPGQLDQEHTIDLQHDNGVDSTSQASHALDGVNHPVTPAVSLAESQQKSMRFSMLQATLPQCTIHIADHGVMNMVPAMIDSEENM
jgi:hypothetical protein